MPLGDTTNYTIKPPTNLPRFGTRTTPPPRAELGRSSTTGLLLKDGTLRSPSSEVREILMGFTGGDTEAAGLTPEQRIQMIGQCTNLNMLHWASPMPAPPPGGSRPPDRGNTQADNGRTPIRSLKLSPISRRHMSSPDVTHQVITTRQGQRPRPAPYLGPRGSYQRNGSTPMARISKATHDRSPP